ncbi:MAG: DsrE family protein [Gammaproteobacteria bacterium]
MKTLYISVIAFLYMMLTASISLAADKTPDNKDALKGLTSSKAIFDITTGNPKKLAFYLKLVRETAESMHAAGVKTDFILAFRGPATFYVTSDQKHVKIKDMPIAYKIKDEITMLSHEKGVKLTQCSVAAHVLHVDTSTIYPGVKVIGNSWVSLIGYENKGYALVPVR